MLHIPVRSEFPHPKGFPARYRLLKMSLRTESPGAAVLGTGIFPAGRVLEAGSDFTFLLLLLLCAKGYTITRGRLRQASSVKLTIFLALYVVSWGVLFVYEQMVRAPADGSAVMLLMVHEWLLTIGGQRSGRGA